MATVVATATEPKPSTCVFIAIFNAAISESRHPAKFILKDKSLSKCTTDQLHQRASAMGLDSQRIRKKRRLIHMIVEKRLKESFDQDHRRYEVNPSGKTFLDLPGEIRNQIYSLVLIEEEPIRATLLYATKTFYSIDHPKYYTKYYGRHEVPTSPARPALKALGRLGWINHAVRHEARAHFYANNKFIIHGHCTTFLRAIGPVGRVNITHMEFRHGSTNRNIVDRDLVRLVNECVNVKTLKISCDVALTCQGHPWETRTTVAKIDSSDFIDTLKGLENLDQLKIALTVESSRPLPGAHCRLFSAFSDLPKLASVFLQALNISYPGKDVELNIESFRITTREGM